MPEEVRVINIMADGSVCEDLSTYLAAGHKLPENAARIIAEMIREGARKTAVSDS